MDLYAIFFCKCEGLWGLAKLYIGASKRIVTFTSTARPIVGLHLDSFKSLVSVFVNQIRFKRASVSVWLLDSPFKMLTIPQTV